jgi:hypothetical protein
LIYGGGFPIRGMDVSSRPDREYEENTLPEGGFVYVGGFPIQGMDAFSRPDRE